MKNHSDDGFQKLEICGENMVLSPVDENSTKLICDCQLSYLYYPDDNSCYEAYTRGPCPFGNHLILPEGEKISRCEKNSCTEEGVVLFKGKCLRLWARTSLCESPENKRSALIVNDFQLSCSEPTYDEIITAPPKVCPNGSRRILLGACKKVFAYILNSYF